MNKMDVCRDQKTFNNAVYKAIKHTREKDAKKMAEGFLVYLVIHVIFLIWGVILAFKAQPPQNRILHIVLAILFAPIYVIAYYLDML